MTEADVQNEEMYEEEDDLPSSFAYGLGSSSFELRMRMQAYWEQQFALRNAMSLAAAGGNLNNLNATSQPPLSLRDYYQRFAQQYPLSLSSNQYLFPGGPIPQNPQINSTFVPPVVVDPTSPSMSSSHSNSPIKSPVVSGGHRRPSSTAAPYSAANSQRNRRLSANPPTEHHSTNLQQRSTPTLLAQPKMESDNFIKSPFQNDMFTAQSYQPSISPFTTQLPNHMQQYHLPDFVDPSANIPVQSVSLDKLSTTDAVSDMFSSNQDWTSFLGQSQMPSKLTPYEDGTNWDDYLDGDANWLLGSSQPDQDQRFD